MTVELNVVNQLQPVWELITFPQASMLFILLSLGSKMSAGQK
jgi:hypothetical protein